MIPQLSKYQFLDPFNWDIEALFPRSINRYAPRLLSRSVDKLFLCPDTIELSTTYVGLWTGHDLPILLSNLHLAAKLNFGVICRRH